MDNGIHNVVDKRIHNDILAPLAPLMLALSQTVGYAIEALATLADPDCANRPLTDIAECSGVPRPYLAKIIAALGRKGLVTARRGVGGGVVLARPAENISLLDVVEAVEGPDWLGDCLLSLRDCSSAHSCPTHDLWARFRKELVAELRGHTLAETIQFHSKHARPRPACCQPVGTSQTKPASPRRSVSLAKRSRKPETNP